MTTVDNPMARWSYANGIGSLDYATDQVALIVEIGLIVSHSRAIHAGSFPGSGPDPTINSISGKVIATLLNAGWSPPDGVPLTLAAEPVAEGMLGDRNAQLVDTVRRAAAVDRP